jgi:glyoxylase-like metal-dependent hydrolase (beta-lactamase superfamily II)
MSERAQCVLAPNPGPMTLDGTNTWVLAEPGSSVALVVDPGPDHAAHRAAVLDVVAALDARVGLVLLTHGHPDHAEGAVAFSRQAGGVPVRALDPAHRLGDEGLAGGDRVEVGGLVIEVLATPGHTSDSLSFHLPADRAVLTGDTVLGRGTSVVAHPDGRLADYLGSLDRLLDFAQTRQLAHILPGHGPTLGDPVGVIEGYQRHRQQRLDQVAVALSAGARSAEDVVAVVYSDVPRSVWPAAELSVRAQLDYLREERALG